MDCQHDNPELHADCSADCLIYDCGSEAACCNSDCHPDEDAGMRAFWEDAVLIMFGLLVGEKIRTCS